MTFFLDGSAILRTGAADLKFLHRLPQVRQEFQIEKRH